MNNLYTALTLSLVNRNRFVITTNDPKQLIPNFQSVILQQQCNIDHGDLTVIDLNDYVDKTITDLVLDISSYYDGVYTFKLVVLWKNLQTVPASFQRQLYELILKIDNFDTNGSKGNTYSQVDDLRIERPDLFIIIPVLDVALYSTKIFQYLKERFSFLINYNYTSLEDIMSEAKLIEKFPSEKPQPILSYIQYIQILRANRPRIFMSPDIKRYIYSLVVFTRLHRLCSLAPKQTRMSTRSIDEIRDLSIALTLWMNFQNPSKYFVTPDTVKIAMRRVGYWLVDWEYNTMFRYKSPDDATEMEKRLQISILVGDWYGSDYSSVEKYIKLFHSKLSKSSPTGYTNKIIDDVLKQVRPPI